MLVFNQALGLRTSLLSGSLTLVIMTLPTIIRTTQESLKTVPQGYREGALGLGAGKWAYHPHHRAALQHRRRRYRLHPGRGPHRGRALRCCSPLALREVIAKEHCCCVYLQWRYPVGAVVPAGL